MSTTLLIRLVSLPQSLLVALIALAACTPTATQMTTLMQEHPEIMIKAIEKHPELFMESLQKAAQSSDGRMRESAARDEAKTLDEEFKNPLKPEIDAKRTVLGSSAAPVVIVEYTDFQCPFCSRGYATIEEVRKMYGSKVKVLVKNLPLPMHALAMPAAKRFEAVRLQGPGKAEAFYRELFENQQKLNSDGEKFLDAAVKKAGANVAKAKKDAESAEVKATIEKDMEEAAKFGIQGTPGFLVNGVTVRGAYPAAHFKMIIDRHLGMKNESSNRPGIE
jgi:protein-disulfide isomerase